MNAPISPLYIWLGTDPLGAPPDTEIEDIPGVSDLQLLGEALAAGHFGTIIPAKIALSTHREPNPSGYRSVDVARLLRDLQIPHRRCYELLPREPSKSDA
ncbi:MAG TPA: hypothetical protein VFI42_07460 [Thermomicrobiaceae bacterium]|nr:hypothetical protein [Thermomicrobiaceae bacterium]